MWSRANWTQVKGVLEKWRQRLEEIITHPIGVSKWKNRGNTEGAILKKKKGAKNFPQWMKYTNLRFRFRKHSKSQADLMKGNINNYSQRAEHWRQNILKEAREKGHYLHGFNHQATAASSSITVEDCEITVSKCWEKIT